MLLVGNQDSLLHPSCAVAHKSANHIIKFQSSLSLISVCQPPQTVGLSRRGPSMGIKLSSAPAAAHIHMNIKVNSREELCQKVWHHFNLHKFTYGKSQAGLRSVAVATPAPQRSLQDVSCVVGLHLTQGLQVRCFLTH
ncbi:hypothetical protein INR49_016554 [Caranx melampygus]|nr:hypothetical protein INR49_016554 [Caranx melampygus]